MHRSLLLHLMHHPGFIAHLCPPCLCSFSQIQSPPTAQAPLLTFPLGAIVSAMAWVLDAPSLLRSFMPVENVHSLLGSYKNASSSRKPWKNILFPIVEAHDIWRLCNYARWHSRADHRDFSSRKNHLENWMEWKANCFSQSDCWCYSCHVPKGVALFGFLEFRSASKHSPRLIL